ncbi:endo-1,3-alpha-glucanase family glycosylhydrolase [Caballeronia sp. 15715]|uniref:endo-1,3-alpha-glucanase family glycosylhydrolase n=1 Tax=Caballeronia sp. 15715 TaxID=3391030 RepID=UPI0039E5DA1D
MPSCPITGRRRFMLACLSLSCTVPLNVDATVPPPGADSRRKRVFAHYMVAWPRGGPHATVASYEAECRDAHARGIDGFALNCGGWNRSEPHYKQRVLHLYDAAAHLDFDFKLFVSADGRAQDEIEDIVATTRGLKAQLLVDNKPVLSAYAAGGKDFTSGAALMREAGRLGAFFVPHFFPSSGERQISARDAAQIAEQLGSADGYFYFGAAGSPNLIAESTKALSAELKSRSKVFMAPVTPTYRGLSAGTNYRAFETSGFSGMATEWEAAITSGATWVQIVTWNDWAESTYVAPIGGNGRAHVYDDRFGDLLSHTGYLDASKYYIEWFKSGSKPTIMQDRLFYFYRLNLLGQDHPGSSDAHDARTPPRTSEPLSSQIHVSVFLTAPAVLVVSLGSVQDAAKRFDVPAGVTHVSVDARAGTPRFVLQRHGKTLIDKTGDQAISADDFSGAYNYFSGSADA